MSARFQTTQWSVVLAARDGSPSQAQDALATLCSAYWEPLYAFTRRLGYSVEEAEDLTQGFFTQLLDKEHLSAVRRSAGKLRSFLRVALKHFLANQRDKARALKRGGGNAEVSLDVATAESHYALEAADHLTPEMAFERRWALTVVERVLEQLEDEATRANRRSQFERLRGFLTDDRPRMSYRELGEEVGMSEGAIKMAVHRLRRRFGECLRSQIAETVAEESQVDSEIRHLLAVLG